MPRPVRAALNVPRTAAAGGWQRAVGFAKLLRPPVLPQGAYTRQATAPIGNNGIAQTLVGASGTAMVPLGPSGVGTRWYPQQVTISTTTGPNDTSTCICYLGPPSAVGANILFTSYAGGGDTQGVAVPQMQPGDFLMLVWTGAKPGDWANARVIGDQDVLVPG